LKEGLLRSMLNTTISKITVSDLCKVAGVNRATFYNHYDTPTSVLRDIAYDYADMLHKIYYSTRSGKNTVSGAAVEACLEYLHTKKQEIKILFSDNAENCMSGFALQIITDSVQNHKEEIAKSAESMEDTFLYAIITSSAAFALIKIWLTMDIKKTPKEIVELLVKVFGEKYIS